MTKQEFGYMTFGGWGLKLVIARGKLRQIVFLGKGRDDAAQEPEMGVADRQLQEYFSGNRKGFTLEIEFEGTQFQKDVWNALLEIPYGETRSYKQIAEQIGSPRAFQAVGQAAHNNPLPIVIPCHRLVGSNGSLTGFAGGLEMKQQLLQLEQKNTEH